MKTTTEEAFAEVLQRHGIPSNERARNREPERLSPRSLGAGGTGWTLRWNLVPRLAPKPSDRVTG